MDIRRHLENLSNSLDAKDVNELLTEKTNEEIIIDINNDLKNNLIELKKRIQNYIINKIKNISKIVFEAETDILNFYKDEYILIPPFQDYYDKYFGDVKRNDIFSEIYNYIINSSGSLIDILLHEGFLELIKSIFGSKYYILNVIKLIKTNYSNAVENALIKFSNLSKDYIMDIINLLDFILLNFEINFNEEQNNEWSSLKLLYEEKKNEILKENKNISKALETNKEIIEKRKNKSDE